MLVVAPFLVTKNNGGNEYGYHLLRRILSLFGALSQIIWTIVQIIKARCKRA
jgi:hypothetical protein